MKEKPLDSKSLHEERNRRLEKAFTKTESEQLEIDPFCDNCDISLLYKIIRIACEKISDEDNTWKTPSTEIEHLIWQIKDRRNDVTHLKLPKIHNDENFCEEIEILTELLMRTLEATKIRYERNEDEITIIKKEVLKAISDTRKEVQQRAATIELPNFKRETNDELQNHLNHAKYFDPLHFLSGRESNMVDVQTLFSRIDVVKEGNGGLLGAKDTKHVD